jgi:hypothetical protein
MLCNASNTAEITQIDAVENRPGAGIHATIANNNVVASRHVHTRPAKVSRIICGIIGTTSLKVESAIPAATDKNLNGDITNTISARIRHSVAMLRLDISPSTTSRGAATSANADVPNISTCDPTNGHAKIGCGITTLRLRP